MHITTISAVVAVPVISAAAVHVAPINHVDHSKYMLTSQALIIDPVDNQQYADLATSLYLNPLGFDGTPTTLIMPEVIPGDDLAQAVNTGVQDVVAAVEQQYSAGDLSPIDPLYIFGYSQGAVVASLAEQQLADAGIPSGDLQFVLVGDSASADGGFLNSQFAEDTLAGMGLGDVLGATTPDNLYPTDVYTLSADGWANWDNGTNLLGMFVDHLEYLGLTPQEVGSATLSLADGLTHYYTINSASVDGFSALLESL